MLLRNGTGGSAVGMVNGHGAASGFLRGSLGMAEGLSISGIPERLLDVTALQRDRRGRRSRDGRESFLVAEQRTGPRQGPRVGRGTTMSHRVIVTTGLATLYVAASLAALSLVLRMWSSAI